MNDKIFFINAYFDQLNVDIERAQELVENDRYHLEGILVLSCHIGSMAAMRFPQNRDSEAYVKVVLDYSGLRSFYERIDLLFLYQWPRSKLSGHGTYQSLEGYSKISAFLEGKYGTEENIKAEERRYVPQDELINEVIRGAPDLDAENVREKLPLFNLAQILYRYVRCDAVHNLDFPLLNRGTDANGNQFHRPNHAINHDRLLETTRGISANLRAECVDKTAWPYEL